MHTVQSLNKTILASIPLLLAACSTVFTGFTPDNGQVCDEVHISREGGHRCGTHVVAFNGVRATDARLEPRPGTDLIAVVPPGATTGNLTVRQYGPMGCFIIGALDSDLYDLGVFTVTGSPASPNIISLNALPSEIDAGEATTLQWSITGTTTRLELDSDESGTVDVTGAINYMVAPTRTTSYRLTAFNECVFDRESETILVNEVQETPIITDVDSNYPGESVTVDGDHLRFRPRDDLPYVETSLIFVQSGTTYAPVVDDTPSDSRLDGDLPETINPGPASVRARVGVLESEPFDFIVSGRENGSFVSVTLHTSGSHTCASRTLDIIGDGEERTANFEEGGSRLWRESFTLGLTNTGAGFSGDCAYGVIVGQNTARDDNKFILLIRDFAARDIPIRETNLGQDVKVMFSPDDSVALYKAQDDFRGVGFAVIHLFDMVDGGPMPDPGTGNSCTACNSLSARVDDFNDVVIIFDGRDFGPYHID